MTNQHPRGDLDIKLTGQPHVRVGDQPLALPSKIYCLLLALTDCGGVGLSREQACSLLWPEHPPGQARSNLRQLLKRMRIAEQKTAIQLIESGGDHLILVPDPRLVDVGRLQRLDINTSRDAQVEFATLFDGPLLDGIKVDSGFHDWLAVRQSHLINEFMRAAERLLLDPADRMCAADKKALSRKVLSIDRTQEFAYQAMIETYLKAGDVRAARNEYQLCKQILACELDVAPSSTLQALIEHRLKARPQAVEAARTTTPEFDREMVSPQIPRVLILAPTSCPQKVVPRLIVSSLIEDITIGLFRYRSFAVMAPFTGKSVMASDADQAEQVKAANCDYVITTGIRPRHDGLVLSLAARATPTGTMFWASEFPVDPLVLPELYHNAVAQIVSELAHSIEREDMALPSAANSHKAYHAYLHGRTFLLTNDLPSIRRARKAFTKAINADDRYSAGYAGASRTYLFEWLACMPDDKKNLELSYDLGRRALIIDHRDGRGAQQMASACLYLRQHDESLELFEHAVELNPHDADLLADQADALAHSGFPEQGLKKIRQAISLNPACPDTYHWYEGSIQYQMHKYEAAIHALNRMRNINLGARLLAASHAQLNQMADATRFREISLEEHPAIPAERTEAMVPNKYKEDTQHYLDGLSKAGLH